MNIAIIYPSWSSFGFYDISPNEADAKLQEEGTPFGIREIAGWLSDDVSGSASAKALITRLEECELRGQPEYLGFGNERKRGQIYFSCILKLRMAG